MSSIRKTTKILFLSEVSVVLLTANLLVIKAKHFLTRAMASSFREASCTKRSKGVFGTHSYIKDGVYAKKFNGFKYFCKKLDVWLGSKYASFHESLRKCNF